MKVKKVVSKIFSIMKESEYPYLNDRYKAGNEEREKVVRLARYLERRDDLKEVKRVMENCVSCLEEMDYGFMQNEKVCEEWKALFLKVYQLEEADNEAKEKVRKRLEGFVKETMKMKQGVVESLSVIIMNEVLRETFLMECERVLFEIGQWIRIERRKYMDDKWGYKAENKAFTAYDWESYD